MRRPQGVAASSWSASPPPGAGGGPCPAARRSSGLAEKGDASPCTLRQLEGDGSVPAPNFFAARRRACLEVRLGDVVRRGARTAPTGFLRDQHVVVR